MLGNVMKCQEYQGMLGNVRGYQEMSGNINKYQEMLANTKKYQGHGISYTVYEILGNARKCQDMLCQDKLGNIRECSEIL